MDKTQHRAKTPQCLAVKGKSVFAGAGWYQSPWVSSQGFLMLVSEAYIGRGDYYPRTIATAVTIYQLLAAPLLYDTGITLNAGRHKRQRSI